jgi:hypothetical protein
MPNVTITPPSVIKVRVEGQSSKVKSINYSPKTLKDSVDVSTAGGNTGDVLTYDAASQLFSLKPIGANTAFSGSMIPSQTDAYNIGSPTMRWKSLYLSGNTIVLGGAVLTVEPTSGALAITAAPTESNPNPIGVMITQTGGFLPVNTIDGVPVPIDYQTEVTTTTEYRAFGGTDAGFF